MINDWDEQSGGSIFAKNSGAGGNGKRPSLRSATPSGFEKKSYESFSNPDKRKSHTGVSESHNGTISGAAKVGTSGNNTAVVVRTGPIQQVKKQKQTDEDGQHLRTDRRLLRRAHTLTYGGLFLFTFVLYFRPYELSPSLSFLNSAALITALATFLIYLPAQFTKEGNLMLISTEVKCILLIAAWALLTIPIAKDSSLAWKTFSETFIKVVLIFIIMLNTLRTRRRIVGLIWLAIGVALMLSYQAVDLYSRGEFNTEGYRVSSDLGGMFGNPNDMAIHLAIFTPIAISLGLATRIKLAKLLYFASAIIMIVGSTVTQSRGGFLGLLAGAGVLVWKLGRKKRLKAVLIFVFIGTSLVAFAPDNYGVRLMSIVDSSLDPVGSSSARTELLKRSILVTLRNPFGIGLGNFPVVGQNNLQTHNSYTQVSSELGWFCLAAYLILLISPMRKLGAVERELVAKVEHSWDYYMAIGIQASIAAYMVASFFGSVAYYWFAYYPIAFAVCLYRIHLNDAAKNDEAGNREVLQG